jgi:DNA-binding winged helix-turn-helix (wHTH) protein/TolB-like protein/Flp pilus assembly protein TadD
MMMRRCRFGVFEFDLDSGELRRDGEVVKLAPQPTRVLTLLLEQPGELVLRDSLKAHVWDDETFVDFERGLNFCILQVRGALGDTSDNPRFVQTIPRRGYRFIAPVKLTGATTQSSEQSTESHIAQRSHEAAEAVRRVAPRWVLVAGAVIGVAVVAGFVLLGRSAHVPTTVTPGMRVVVLPFLNLTGDRSLEYLGDGLTDEVIGQLGLLSGQEIVVIARTSAMSYRHSPKNISQIGAELNVSYIVESSVRRQGDSLRIASNLIRVADQSRTASWIETFGPGLAPDDLRQTRAAARLARLIAIELRGGTVDANVTASTADTMAWNSFLKAKVLKNSGATRDIREALVHFEAAVKRDPGFAAAWAGVAETRHLLVMMGGLAPDDAYAAAGIAAKRAVSGDPNLSDAYVAQGLVQLWHQWRPAEAARSFERALSLNPSHAAAHHDYAWSLLALGREHDAIRHITIARDLDPVSTRANADVGWLHLQLREPIEAARAGERTLAIDASSLEAQGCLERAHVQRGSVDMALEAAKATLPQSSGFIPVKGENAQEGLRAIWRWRLQHLDQAAQTRWISPYTVAGLRASLGDTDKAIEDLEAAYDDRVGMMVFLRRDPVMDPVRHHPRVQALISRVEKHVQQK